MMSALALHLWRLWTRARNRIFTAAVSAAFRYFGKGSTFQTPLTLWGERRISIGSGVHIGPGCWLLALGDEETPAIEIGDGCSFAGGVTITAEKSVIIGREVLMGRNIHISDHAHETSDHTMPIIRQGTTPAKPVRVGDGAWIGQGVVICPGVSIGRNSIIGANSVVKSDVPDYCVAAGAPARVVRRNGAPS
jgi:acetyltransferase-like isoleucine patch superfamily enzyme